MLNKRIKIVLLSTLLAVAIFLFGIQMAAKPYLESSLEEKIPNHIDLMYSDVEVNILTGSVVFTTPSIRVSKENQHGGELAIDLEAIHISDIGYWNLIFNKKLDIAELVLVEPRISFEKSNQVIAKDLKNVQLLKTISIASIRIENGSLDVSWMNGKRKILLESLSVEITDAETNPNLINAKIPFTFSSIEYNFKNLTGDFNKYEELSIDEIQFFNQEFNIRGLSWNTLLSKAELSKRIGYERDHVNLQIPHLQVETPQFYYKGDSLQVIMPKMNIEGLVLDIFRDKSLPDDTSYKPLYAKILKDLPFKLTLDTITMSDGLIVYEEEVKNKIVAGQLRFEDVNGQIKNVSNMYSQQEDLEISLASNLMGKGKLELNWAFNVHSPEQRFLASGSLLNFETSSLNDFLEPNLRVRTEGNIQNLYFTIDGDELTAVGDVKMRYHDFKFIVLKRDKLRVNKLFTFIGNLFIDDGSKADEDGYRYGKIDVQRYQNKSFFNYLWISLQDGMLDVLSGNGKKEIE